MCRDTHALLATTRAAQFECETRIKKEPKRIGAWQRHALLEATARAANTSVKLEFSAGGGPLRETRKNPMRALGNPREEN